MTTEICSTSTAGSAVAPARAGYQRITIYLPPSTTVAFLVPLECANSPVAHQTADEVSVVASSSCQLNNLQLKIIKYKINKKKKKDFTVESTKQDLLRHQIVIFHILALPYILIVVE
jgi:hypothetical protein